MHRIYIWAVFLLLASGCNLSSLEDTVVIPDVSEEFYLDLWEELTPEGRFLEFRLRTIADEPCRNAKIAYEFQQTSRELSISINEIIREEGCEAGEAPAKADILTSTPLSGGFYLLRVDLRDKVSAEGRLVVSSGSYSINLEEDRGIVLLRPRLMRIPDETIWGYIFYEEEALEVAATAFLADLELASEPVSLPEGYYGYFRVESNREVKFSTNTAPAGAIPFAYRYDGDKEALTALLEAYRSEYGEALNIKLFNTRGEEL